MKFHKTFTFPLCQPIRGLGLRVGPRLREWAFRAQFAQMSILRVLDGCHGPRVIEREANGVFLKMHKRSFLLGSVLVSFIITDSWYDVWKQFALHLQSLVRSCWSNPLSLCVFWTFAAVYLQLLLLCVVLLTLPLSSFHNNTAGKDEVNSLISCQKC